MNSVNQIAANQVAANQVVANQKGIRDPLNYVWAISTIPILSQLTQLSNFIPEAIKTREVVISVDTLGKCRDLAMLLAKLVIGKVVGFCGAAWSLAAVHPVIAISIVLTLVVIPVLKEYRARKGELTLKATPIIVWMILTRPFRLVYRIITAITGGVEVDRQKITQTVTLLKTSHPALRQELQAKQQVVASTINTVADNDTRAVLRFTVDEIFEKTDEIIKDEGFDERHILRWNYLQDLISGCGQNPRLANVKEALDEWKKSLDLCILTK
ncbi:MAG: hypothetical protein LBJ75_02300 [Puniceicoccales bacterium]|nr:hypothetical protein [Puniceicoccales bacterium]